MSYNDKKIEVTTKEYNDILDEFDDAVKHLEIPRMEPENPFNLTFEMISHKDESLDNYLSKLVEKYGSDESLCAVRSHAGIFPPWTSRWQERLLVDC